MILEVAILDVKNNQQKEFETAFNKAQSIISSMSGYVSHQLQKCIEKENRFYEPFPEVEHYQILFR